MSRKLFFVLILAAAVFTSACGLTGGNPATIPTSTPETTVAPTPAPTPEPTPTPPPPPPMIQTEGDHFVDDEGNTVVLRGIALMDVLLLASQYQPQLGHWDENLFRELHEWGATVVRFPIHPPNYHDVGAEGTLGVLDQAVEWARKYDLYVIIDFHGIGFPPDDFSLFDWAATDVEEMTDFWDQVSRHFAGDNTVAFYEIYNEPGRNHDGMATAQDWQDWKKLAESTIDMIRHNDPDTVVIVDALDFGNNLSPMLVDPIEKPNIAYSCHPYPAQSRWIDWDTAFGDMAEAYPVILTEFGYENAADADELIKEENYAGEGRYRDDLMAYTAERGIGWVAWVFSADWGPRMLTDIDTYAPTEYGAFIRDRLQFYRDN